jgi:hypothetical protein
MTNQAAVRFVKKVIAAFSKFPTGKDVADLYEEKLSKWQLTTAQWESALDYLIENHKDDGLPALNEIYGVLKIKKSAAVAPNNLGFMSFTSNGCSYAVRVRCDGSVWVSCKTGRVVNLPNDASAVIVSPDCPARYEPEEMPSAAERVQLFRQIQDNLSKVKNMR